MTQYVEGQEVRVQLRQGGIWWPAKILYLWNDNNSITPWQYEVTGTFGQRTISEERIKPEPMEEENE